MNLIFIVNNETPQNEEMVEEGSREKRMDDSGEGSGDESGEGSGEESGEGSGDVYLSS